MDAATPSQPTASPFLQPTSSPPPVQPPVAGPTHTNQSPPATNNVDNTPVHVGINIPRRLVRVVKPLFHFGIYFLAAVAGAAGYAYFSGDKAPATTPPAAVQPSAQSPDPFAPQSPGKAAPKRRLAFFTFPGCDPCRVIRPAIDQAKADGIPITVIDLELDYNGKTGRSYWKEWGVTEAPTFILIEDGREIARAIGIDAGRGGLATAKDIELFYGNDQFRSTRVSVALPKPTNPFQQAGQATAKAVSAPVGLLGRIFGKKPLETTVRIRVHEGGLMGVGSGTVVESNANETIVVSCGHIFEGNGGRTPVTVECFDGSLTRAQANGPVYTKATGESYRAEVLSYNLRTDVSVLRIKPGKIMACSPVVPTIYQPTPGTEFVASGCPEGEDATAWSTKYLGTSAGPSGQPVINCTTAPKKGRSGGGLHVTPSYELVGVLDFASPTDNRGLYATPASIHAELRRAGYGHLVREAA